MKPIINVEECPGKVVGRNAARPEAYDQLVRTSRSLMPRLPFPKGVFRFSTHEEADTWTEKYILQAALIKARAHQNEAT